MFLDRHSHALGDLQRTVEIRLRENEHELVVAVPGLLIPLLWWFVAKPLGAGSAASVGGMTLIATTLAALLIMAALAMKIDLTAIGVRPDMATPSLAAGLLLALACYAAPRPLRRLLTLRPADWARTAVGNLPTRVIEPQETIVDTIEAEAAR